MLARNIIDRWAVGPMIIFRPRTASHDEILVGYKRISLWLHTFIELIQSTLPITRDFTWSRIHIGPVFAFDNISFIFLKGSAWFVPVTFLVTSDQSSNKRNDNECSHKMPPSENIRLIQNLHSSNLWWPPTSDSAFALWRLNIDFLFFDTLGAYQLMVYN